MILVDVQFDSVVHKPDSRLLGEEPILNWEASVIQVDFHLDSVVHKADCRSLGEGRILNWEASVILVDVVFLNWKASAIQVDLQIVVRSHIWGVDTILQGLLDQEVVVQRVEAVEVSLLV